MSSKTILLCFFSVPLLFGTDNENVQARHTTSAPSLQPKKITIFIHGTRMIRFFPLNISTRLKNFDASLSTPTLGLHHYRTISKTNNQVRIAKTLSDADPTMFPLDTFYFFGWSGKLNINERRQAAKKLVSEIQSLIIDPYKKIHGINPEITLITHSHGGNVALNIARQKELLFTVKNLIMLACPVQEETKKFIGSCAFETIYSFYSHHDTLQTLDPQLFGTIGHGVRKAFIKKSISPLKKLWHKLTCPLFSSRQFHTSHSLYQINVAWKDNAYRTEPDFDVYGPLRYFGEKIISLSGNRSRGLHHIEFLMPTFIKKIPVIIKSAQLIKKDSTFYIS